MSGPTCSTCGAPLAPSQARRFGATCPDCVIKFAADESFPEFPNLRIVGRIGRGGMGVVYEAEQPQLGRRVALKVLSPHLAFDERFMARFQAEARILAQLQHPNIVTVFDVGVHGGLPYILLERVEGHALRKILADGPMKPARALEIAAAVFDALGCAHQRGIVHRDIKPENILIDGQGRVKLADFGLAKPPQSRRAADSGKKVRVGTLRYMAPEQLDRPDKVDARADLYSAGVVLLEMLTGKPPEGAGEKISVPRRAPKGVQALLRRLLAPDPARRLGSADEARKAVETLLAPGPRRRRR